MWVREAEIGGSEGIGSPIKIQGFLGGVDSGWRKVGLWGSWGSWGVRVGAKIFDYFVTSKSLNISSATSSWHTDQPTYLEGWRDGGMEGWRNGGMEGWRDGGMEEWRYGGMEGWRYGGMEGWKDGRMEGWSISIAPVLASCCQPMPS